MSHLINCPTCGHQISFEALSCPSCGHHIKDSNTSKLLKIVLYIMIFGVVAYGLLYIFLIFGPLVGGGAIGAILGIIWLERTSSVETVGRERDVHIQDEEDGNDDAISNFEKRHNLRR